MSNNLQKAYENARVAVDAAIFTVIDASLRVYLKPREKEPDNGKLELLGGLILPGETAEQTLVRKVSQSIPELVSIYFEQFYTFTEPKRDPRVRTVSVGFIALAPSHMLHDLSSWYEVANLKNLAFDHYKILNSARQRLSDLADISIARHILPKLFRLNELHQTLEILHGKTYDNRNFRRMALSSGKIIATSKKDSTGPFRPATLYRFIAE